MDWLNVECVMNKLWFEIDPPPPPPRRAWKRWALWGVVLAFTPAIAMSAYMPSFLAIANNLSDLASAATARTNLGVPPSTRLINTTAPVAGGGDLSADRTITVNNCTATVTGTVPTPPNNTTTFLRGDCTFATPTATVSPVAPTIYTSTLPVTLASTNGLVEVIEMATPAAGVINLPATPTAGTLLCVKDGKLNFASNIATVKTTDSSTIDKVAGATGFAMNQNGQNTCFLYAPSVTNWYVQ
jgi:hypothetical protein